MTIYAIYEEVDSFDSGDELQQEHLYLSREAAEKNLDILNNPLFIPPTIEQLMDYNLANQKYPGAQFKTLEKYTEQKKWMFEKGKSKYYIEELNVIE